MCVGAGRISRRSSQRNIAARALLLPAAKRDAILSVAGLSPAAGGTLLDVGCGNGEFITRMRSLGWKVSGVDPDPAAVAFGQSNGLDIFTGMIADVPETLRYDVVVLNHVIEHVADPVSLLQECGKRLRPGVGRLVITTPNINSFGHHRFGKFWRGLEVPRHFTVFPSAHCVSVWNAPASSPFLSAPKRA